MQMSPSIGHGNRLPMEGARCQCHPSQFEWSSRGSAHCGAIGAQISIYNACCLLSSSSSGRSFPVPARSRGAPRGTQSRPSGARLEGAAPRELQWPLSGGFDQRPIARRSNLGGVPISGRRKASSWQQVGKFIQSERRFGRAPFGRAVGRRAECAFQWSGAKEAKSERSNLVGSTGNCDCSVAFAKRARNPIAFFSARKICRAQIGIIATATAATSVLPGDLMLLLRACNASFCLQFKRQEF